LVLSSLSPVIGSWKKIDVLPGAVNLINAINTADNIDGPVVLNLTAGATYLLTSPYDYWYGPDGLPPITKDITIDGNGATIERPAITRTGKTPDFRLFYDSVHGGMGGPGGDVPDAAFGSQDAAQDVGGGGGGFRPGDNGNDAGIGGGIFNMGVNDYSVIPQHYATLTMTDCTLNGNTAQGGVGGDGFSDGNGGDGGDGYGGAVFNVDGTVNLADDTLDGNTVTGGSGGSGGPNGNGGNDGEVDGGALYSLCDRLHTDRKTTPESLARLAAATYALGHPTDEIGDKQHALDAYEGSRSGSRPSIPSR